jgi:hypothetical protein
LSQGEVKEYCHHNGICLDLASVAHPQSNGQVERTNGLILSGIKPRLEAPLHRLATCAAASMDHTKQINGPHPFLPSLRSRSNPAK